MLRLPSFEELSECQQEVYDLPLDGSHIITGPPGSGKTVMAVYRADMLQRKLSEPTLLLMFGRLLSQYVDAAVRSLGVEGTVWNYHKWFRQFFQVTYGRPAPTVGGPYKFDWDECIKIIGESPPPPKIRPHVIVDEGQDMPKEFFAILRMVATSMTIFADENQQITDDRSTVDEISAVTGIRSIHHLPRNFRNTRAIAAVAATFYTGAGAGPVELRDDAQDGDRPTLESDLRLNGVIERLVRYEKTAQRKVIGVLLLRIDLLKKFYNRLDGKTKNPVQVYMASSRDMGARRSISFGTPGIKLISYTSAKGLEFDTVFLPELQANSTDPMSTGFRMQMYVMTSRARADLAFLYSGEGEPRVVGTLPLELIEDRRRT